MPPVPNSSPSNPSSRAIADVEAGLTALKQGDYPRAIALLETTPLPPEHPLFVKAQMGLVLAYVRNGNPQQASALGQSLYQNKNPQVKEWVLRTLQSLAKRYPQLPGLTEFLQQAERVAAESTAGVGNHTEREEEHLKREGEAATRMQGRGDAEAGEASGFIEHEDDLTGFVPFDASTQPEAEVDLTGFAPFRPSEINEEYRAAGSGQQAEGKSQEPRKERSGEDREGGKDGETRGHGDMGNRQSAIARLQSPISAQPQSEPASPYRPTWRQAERAKSWKSVGRVDLAPILLIQAVTAIALFWVVQQMIYLFMVTPGRVMGAIPFLHYRHVLFNPPVWSILILLVCLFVASRWILDALLKALYGLKPLSLNQLGIYSPETVQSLNRFCRQRRLPMPALGMLPTAAPVAFSYGCLPHVTRLVVSQGLLDQLADDEIAAVYASEIGHIGYWDVPLMSLLMVVLQIPYMVYRLVAEWGNRQTAAVLRVLSSWLAALSYGLYWLLRWVGLWLSRQRVYNSDRVAANLTGNPNGFTRALLKIAIGTAKEVEQQGQTSYLLEGFDLLAPLGHQLATPLGSVYPYVPLEAVLEWDLTNPYRHWLSISNSHPPTGDRLHRLATCARQWKLDTELDLGAASPNGTARHRKSVLTTQQWHTLLLQGAPFFGLAFGLGLAFVLSIVGWVGLRLNANQISWLYGDPTVLRGLPLIGFSLGTFIRINPFFPDIKFSGAGATEASAPVVGLLKDPTLVPVDSLPVRLEGKLLGRSGISNLLSQDLLLQTPTGLVRLHCFSPLGPIGNLLPQEIRFTDLLQQDVTATGWFRRGATPWIDIDTLRTAGGRTSRSNHPLWSTLLALPNRNVGHLHDFSWGNLNL
ncbi:M48 family metalloprotease [Kovacikia minuta CCNUW1]|uniref:zinc metalloprotease HtpX n=1 Tax=Kovacikia minuta TaxID=2931930 RepID=UPI001CC961ED|nr:zinc metalloprotease HtpX [Kovacikia minuta]UBF27401.1 M48 family metalloprotease [Kovacikia minuta CCNUW1]